ncbi:MAG: hypothetical protein NT027_05305, partial [Proteobacteria bacterium]|nr:hypothetical protein [Pseudomonadota bacterium]
YTTAKFAGEAICQSLSKQLNLEIFCPRIEMLATDQTKTVSKISPHENSEIIISYLDKFLSQGKK